MSPSRSLALKDGIRRRWRCVAGGMDPYVLVPGEFGDGGISYPPMTMMHIIMFLETSFHSGAKMKAYKAMEPHNLFSSGYVKQSLSNQGSNLAN